VVLAFLSVAGAGERFPRRPFALAVQAGGLPVVDRDGVDDVGEQVLGVAPARRLAVNGLDVRRLSGKVTEQDAEAAPAEPFRAEVGDDVEVVVAEEVGFDRLAVVG